ncbi:hypothetical protein TRAPUB_900 [Trametes pubescens]|uniref:Uncharacterized protein n=1 Tax=Trametes pubescens TaxID=154538 RepID=A0A1M2VKR7_TRAPU|nr:hypothetical protein TRAPUB_900 [Trametes pubescens]
MQGTNLAMGGGLPAAAPPVSTPRRSGKQAASKLIIAPMTSSGWGVVDDSVVAGGMGVPAEPLVGMKSTSTGKLRRATRADVAAYRGADGEGSVAVPDVQIAQDGLAAGYAVNTGGCQPKRKANSTEKRLEEPVPKKGKMTKLTAAAASNVGSPPAPTVSGAVSPTTLPEPTVTTGSSTTSIPSPTVASSAATALPPPANNTTTATTESVPGPGPAVSVAYGSYVSDSEEAIEAAPHAAANVHPAPNKKASEAMTVEVIDVAVASVTAATVLASALAAGTVLPNSRPPAVLPVAGTSSVRVRHWSMGHVKHALGPFSGSFTLTFIPNLINLIGNGANGPWRLFGLDLPGAMNDLALQAKQKLSEYRNGIANKAVDVVYHVAWALDEARGYLFRYGEAFDNVDGTTTKIAIYQSKLIARTLAYHLCRIGLRADQIHDYPCNALALATTAVERALKMWDSSLFKHPKGHSDEAQFSDRLWGKTVNEYISGIVDLEERQWDAILAKAELAMRGLDNDLDDDMGADDMDEDDGDLPPAGGHAAIDDERRGPDPA